jgi:hypothetical protein
MRRIRKTLIVLALLGFLGALTLYFVPIPITFFLPNIQKKLPSHVDFSLSRGYLRLHSFLHPLLLEGHNVKIKVFENTQTIRAQLGRMRLGFSWSQLLKREFYPSFVRIEADHISVEPSTSSKEPVQETVESTLKKLSCLLPFLKSAENTAWGRSLRSVRWSQHLPYLGNVRLQLKKSAISHSNLFLSLHAPGCHGRGQLDTDTGQLNIKMNSRNVSQLLHDLPLGPLSHIKTVEGRLSGKLVPENQTFQAKIALQGKGPNKMRFRMKACMDPACLTISHIHFELGDRIKLQGNANLRFNNPKLPFISRLSIPEIQLDHLSQLWPQGVLKNVYDWMILNIPQGQILGNDVKLNGSLEDASNMKVTWTSKLNNITLQYLKGMPFLTGLEGNLLLTEKGLEINLSKGRTETQTLKRGRVTIEGFEKPLQTIHINADLQGDSQGILKLLSHPPLEYTQKIKVPLNSLQGDVLTNLSISFPLIDALALKDVTLRAQGQIKKASYTYPMGKGKSDITLKGGKLALDTTTKKLNLKGHAFWGEYPLKLSLFEDFERPIERKLTAEGYLRPQDMDKFGLSVLKTYLPKGCDVEVSYRPVQDETLQVRAKLTSYPLELPWLDLKKQRGIPGNLFANVEVGKITKVNNLVLKTPTCTLRGKALWNQGLECLKLTCLMPKRNDFTLQLNRKRGDFWVQIDGHCLNLGSVLDAIAANQKTGGNTSFLGRGQKLDIVFSFNQLLMRNKLPILNSRGTCQLLQTDQGLDPARIHITGILPTAKRNLQVKQKWNNALLLRFQKAQSHTPGAFSIQAGNGGYLLKSLGWLENLSGGKLWIQATEEKPDSGFQGTLKMNTFAIKKTDILVRLFMTLTSPTSFLNLFSSDGKIFVQNFKAKFLLQNQKISIERAAGNTINSGLSLQGIIDYGTDQLDLSGNIIPGYLINRILGRIPILGDVLFGGKDDGLFATRFYVKGPMDNPNFSANPLSTITPGILKRLFNFLEEEKRQKEAKNKSLKNKS